MANFNRVILIGNLTREPELRVTPKGTSVCQFGLAVNRVYRVDGGEQQEETTFVDIEAWGKQAEIIAKYVSKGSPLFVEGRLKLDSWENKEGEKRNKLKVVVENMQLMGGRSDGGGQSRSSSEESPPARARSQSAPPAQTRPPANDDIEEDVPF